MEKKAPIKTKVIFNPKAGDKRNIVSINGKTDIAKLKAVLARYEIKASYAQTRYAGHATKIAKKSVAEGYELILVAGGDGTAAEVISGVVGSKVCIGLIPLGSFMNIARMLGVPQDLEKAIQVIKIGKKHTIDIGSITRMGGKKLADPSYFIEEASFGIEAEMHWLLTGIFERHSYLSLFKLPFQLAKQYTNKTKIMIDGKEMNVIATYVSISNGPYGDAALKLAPKAKLDDHTLTLSVFKMSRVRLAWHFLLLVFHKDPKSELIQRFQGKEIIVQPKKKFMVHADARVFGSTPVTFKIIPGAIKMIVGFPEGGNDNFNN